MKTPIDVVKGRIVSYNPETSEVVIKARYSDWYTMFKRQYGECLVQMVDSRPLSDKQRRACYALIREISDYTGMGADSTKEYLKIKFLAEDLHETADKIFSLSNASMSLVCAFQRFLVDFIVSWEIPCRFPVIDMVDDVNSYIYSCLTHKKCCICGKKSDLHHRDAVGSGRNRETIYHEGMRVLPLCREHHTEMHTIGITEFKKRYHVTDGVPLDKTLCKIYGLK